MREEVSAARAVDSMNRVPTMRWIVFGHLVLLFIAMAIDLQFPQMLILRSGSLGIAAAQLALLSIWLNFGGEPTLRRLLTVLGYLVLTVASHLPMTWSTVPELLAGVSFAALVVLILGLPLSVIRIEGLRLRRFSLERLPPPRRLQFNTFHMLWMMAFVAFVFGLGEVAQSNNGNSPLRTLAFLGMLSVDVMVVLSVPLVAVWVMLTPGRVLPRLATAVFGWLLGGLLIASCYGSATSTLILPVLVFVVAISLLAATLACVRRLGYRLVWRAVGER